MYKLEKPLSIQQRADFIVEYNHNQSLKIEETENAIYALEAWEVLKGDEVSDNTEAYVAEQAQKEAKRLANLKLTKREVFLAIYKNSGITPDDIKSAITDKAALIEMEYANEYYRGNPLIDMVGNSLGYTSAELDYLFENGVFPTKEEAKYA